MVSGKNPVPSETICKRLRIVIALVGLVLIWQTRSLWFGTPSLFPQVPLVFWFTGFPAWWDWAAGGVMVLSLTAVAVFAKEGNPSRIASLGFAAAFLLAVLLNQHRLQPWAYEFCILLLVLALLPASKAVPCLRLIVASIYLHSGLSKLDVTFLTTHGEAMLSVITNSLGWDLASAPVEIRRVLTALLPVGEIAVAAGLLFSRTRPVAKWASVAIHGMLFWILGPLGLGHKPGVLIWNIYFIAQNLLLFRSDDQTAEQSSSLGPTAHLRWNTAAGYSLVSLVVLLPFLEPWGGYDHWPAWAVYASRPERTRVYIAEDRIKELPENVQRFVADDEPPANALERFLAGKPAYRRLKIDRWSLEVLNAPISPQGRFQVGVALALAKEYGLEDDLRMEIDSPAARWTGKRTTRILEGAEAMELAAGEYFFNALPR